MSSSKALVVKTPICHSPVGANPSWWKQVGQSPYDLFAVDTADRFRCSERSVGEGSWRIGEGSWGMWGYAQRSKGSMP